MLSHGSFACGPVVKGILLVLGTMAGQGRPIEWAAHHRKHHAFSDREGDPHSPLDGFVHAYFGWILRGPPAERERYCRRLLQDPLIVFIDRTAAVWVLLGLAIPFAIAGWDGLLWGGFVRMAFFSQVAYSVNSFGHSFGSRAFETTDESRNNWILALLAFGDGWHNNHHAFPSMAYHGMRARQFDPSGYVIRALAALGLAWNVRAAQSAARRAATAAEPRSGGGAMTKTATRMRTSAGAEATLAFLRNLFFDYPRDFAVRLWDGTVWEPDDGRVARFTIVLRHPGAVRAMFLPPGELTISEAFVYDDFDVEGDLEAVFPLGDHLLAREPGLAERLRAMRRLHALPSGRRARVGRQRARLSGRRSSLERDRRAIAYHYDVSNEFFALWLDSTMTYSCAVFASSTEDLERAQQRKLEYVCRKLRLRPGERMLDIGCGWGGLVMHAARHFGVEALGVTLSRSQAELASTRIREAGLADRCPRRVPRLPRGRRARGLRQARECRDVRARGPERARGLLRPRPTAAEAGRGVPRPRNRGLADGGDPFRPVLSRDVRLPGSRGRARLDHADRRRAGKARATRRREPARALHADSPVLARAARCEPG